MMGNEGCPEDCADDHTDTGNAYCMNTTCRWHNNYMLEGPGKYWWGEEKLPDSYGGGYHGPGWQLAHCPQCQWSKYVDDEFVIDALQLVANRVYQKRKG